MPAVPVAPGGANDHHPCGTAISVDSGMDMEQSELPVEAEAHGPHIHNDTGDQGKSGKGKGKGEQTWLGNSSVLVGNVTLARHETTPSQGAVLHTFLCDFTGDHTIHIDAEAAIRLSGLGPVTGHGRTASIGTDINVIMAPTAQVGPYEFQPVVLIESGYNVWSAEAFVDVMGELRIDDRLCYAGSLVFRKGAGKGDQNNSGRGGWIRIPNFEAPPPAGAADAAQDTAPGQPDRWRSQPY